MNQNMPPHQGRPDAYEASPQDGGHSSGGANPYFGGQQSAAAPDLDDSVPLLKSSDVQKLNRKALMFLAGIVALLVMAAIWMFNSATAGDDEKPKVEEEEISIPELPKSAVEELPPPPPPLPVVPTPQPQPEATPVAFRPDQALPPPGPTGPSLLERRMGGSQSTEGAAGSGMMTPAQYAQFMQAKASGEQGAPAKQDQARVASAQPLNNPDTLLLRGTYIRCVMETRIVTDISGFTSCIVTEPVYSVNGRRLLLPKGSKVSGTYGSDNVSGPRVAVIWDRITTPTGLDINMASPGVDNLGGAGHPGHYDAHWGSRITSALLISLISDAFKYAGAKNGPETTTISNTGNELTTPYESNTARTMERLAQQALEKGANRAPTITINQGTVVNVYVAKDVDFSSVLR